MNRFTKLAAMLSVFGVAAISVGAAAQQGQESQQQPSQAQQGRQKDQHPQKLAKQDADFFKKAAEGNLLEVQLGELAKTHGASEDVKKFGQRMIDDHGKLNQELEKATSDKGLSVPQALDKKGRDVVEKLGKKTGKEFDRDYMSRMVDEHQEDIKAFEKEAKEGKDQALKQFASDALPTLREHLKDAKEIHTRLKK
jgi:putative membrane protein